MLFVKIKELISNNKLMKIDNKYIFEKDTKFIYLNKLFKF